MLDPRDQISLKLLLSSLPHRLFIVREVFVSGVLCCHFACFHVSPTIYAPFILELLVVGELSLFELVLEQSFLVDLPSFLEAIDCAYQVARNGLFTLCNLALQRKCFRL